MSEIERVVYSFRDWLSLMHLLLSLTRWSIHSRCITIALALAGLLLQSMPLAAETVQSGDFNVVNVRKQPWRVSRFPQLEGMGLRCIAEDQQNNIWFGVRHGVIRYNGYRWWHFGGDHGLPNSEVRWITSTNDGELIAATEFGLYRQYGDRWERFFPTKSDARVDTTFITVDSKGVIWAASAWGLIRIQDGQSSLFTAADFSQVAAALDWFDEIISLPNHAVPSSSHRNALDARILGDRIAAIGDGGLAERMHLQPGDRLISVNGEKKDLLGQLDRPPGTSFEIVVQPHDGGQDRLLSFVADDVRNESPAPAVNTILPAGDGRIWVGFRFRQLISSNDLGTTWDISDIGRDGQLGLNPNLLEAHDGTLWCFTTGRVNNVHRFKDHQWQSASLRLLSGHPPQNAAVQVADGTIWTAGLDTIWYRPTGLDDESAESNWRQIDARQVGLPSDGHRMLLSSDGSLWVGGFNQSAVRISVSDTEFASLENLRLLLAEQDGDEWYWNTDDQRLILRHDEEIRSYSTDDGIISNPATMISIPGSGPLMLGEHNDEAAIAVFEGGQWIRSTFPRVGKSFSGKAWTVTRDGAVWLSPRSDRNAGQAGGVVVGQDGKWTHYAPPYAPPHSTFIIEQQPGKLWFGGGRRIIEFDGNQWNRISYESLEKESISSAAMDSTGVAWFSTRTNGIIRFQNGQFETLSTHHGLPSNEVTRIFVDASDIVWAGTASGLYRFDGERFSPFEFVQSYIQFPIRNGRESGIWVNGRERFSRNTDPPHGHLSQTQITANDGNAVYLSWEGIDKWNRTAPEDLYWSWKVDDRTWSPFVQRTDTTIRGLPVGEHQVRVRVRDGDFNIVQLPDPAFVTVAPPYWRTARFQVPILVTSCLLLWLAGRLFSRGLALRRANLELANAREQLSVRYAEKTAQFKAVCDCSPIGIFVTNDQYKVTYANPRLAQFAGVQAEELIEKGWLNCVHPEDRIRLSAMWSGADHREMPFRRAGRFLHSNGEVRHFELLADRVSPDSPASRANKPLGYVGVIEDVTKQVVAKRQIENVNLKLRSTLDELRSAQAKAIRQERLTALGHMAAGVAHDINNSLTPLLTYAELLEGDKGLSQQGKSWAGLLKMGVKDTAETVRRLDHFYRDQHHTHSFVPVDLAKIVEQTVVFTRPKWSSDSEPLVSGVTVNSSIRAKPRINGDPSQLRSVVTNLIFNSIEAIDGEGTIEIVVDVREGQAIVEVVDTGIGMSEEQLKRCTDPFYTSKDFGSGLGLSECYGIVRQHGGNLHIHSERNEGTSVRFEIPLLDGLTEQTETSPDKSQALHSLETASGQSEPISESSKAAPPERDVSILCIDDDPTVRASTVALLTARGYVADAVPDGPAGIAYLESHCVQLVICDQGMPGMDGLSVMKTIKTRWPEIQVAMVSGWSLPTIEGELQPDAILQKPFSSAALDQLLDFYTSQAN